MSYISEQLHHTLDEFESDNLGEHYKGKVRENFSQDDKILMITSDRVSAFDCVRSQLPVSELSRLFLLVACVMALPTQHRLLSPDPCDAGGKRHRGAGRKNVRSGDMGMSHVTAVCCDPCAHDIVSECGSKVATDRYRLALMRRRCVYDCDCQTGGIKDD